MPIPIPKKKENEKQFVSRCIETLHKDEEDRFTAKGQKAAVCYSQWRKDNEDKPAGSEKNPR